MSGSAPLPRPLAAVVAAATLAAPSPVRAADMLLLQQTLQPDQPGTAFLQIDRDRLVLARARKEKGFEHTLELTLMGEPPLVVTVRCIDQAATRQLLDALRPGTLPQLDVTARCRL
ncbi:hypothetical protein [Benzoatithermus flavus]|uniref:Uncharacterized protein n=1 Tax=Benzoatithermus flavus TaxID=3108223 RepID=A0ABU8XTE9_9PROT